METLLADTVMMPGRHGEIRRAAAGTALRTTEDRFRTFADFSCDWESWIGPDGRYIYVSPSCRRITGRAPEEFISDPGLFEAIIHPDDREAVCGKMDRGGDKSGVLRFDFRIVTKAGVTRWISHLSQPVFGRDGQWRGRRISHRDITRLKRVIEEREGLIEQLNRALDQVKTLHGILPICVNCKKVRNDGGFWERIEEYISNHTNADFSHGICPECKHLLYPEIFPLEE